MSRTKAHIKATSSVENGPKVIAITGPESTGKSQLAADLAAHFGGVWVPEYAREYLQELNRPYRFEDILHIAKGQERRTNESIKPGVPVVFLDTELTVTRIWCEYLYGKCHSWIVDHQAAQEFDLYLLTNIDLPWQPDPMREHPDKRKELFELYERALQNQHWTYNLVSGVGTERPRSAIRIIEEEFRNYFQTFV